MTAVKKKNKKKEKKKDKKSVVNQVFVLNNEFSTSWPAEKETGLVGLYTAILNSHLISNTCLTRKCPTRTSD